MARFARFGRCRWAGIARRGLLPLVLLASACTAPWGAWVPAQEADPENESAADDADAGVSLPTDRLKERQLDRARRLIADKRWSDAAILLDEILSSDRDFFFRPDRDQATWRSIKSDASRLVASLPQQGGEAYALQFRARADRMLQQAIASGDPSGIVAVARRWFHTPAGQRATMLAAIESLDSNQPLAAAAWLDRLSESGAATFEPTLSVMRATAWWRAGDRNAAIAILEKGRAGAAATARIGGKDVALSFPPGSAADFLDRIAGETGAAARPAPQRRDSEWWLHRGDASRNAISSATRPLLVPRYRVPLTRHPEEARLLEKRRRNFADRDAPLLPAGTPLAVDGSIVLHTPMGLLAVDFESGKRIWLKTAGAASGWGEGPRADVGGDATEDGPSEASGSAQSVFGDATSGTLSSNGKLVFAVESEPAATMPPNGENALRRMAAGLQKSGNALSAYDVSAKGALRWRLSGAGTAEAGPSQPWYMGAPLTIGDQLFVLVEEKGEVRLDVLDAASGNTIWSQPLASLDEDQLADRPDAQSRRLSGLSPSFAEGVLICPTGAGAVVAVDLATRTLLWAYNYPLPPPGAGQVLRNGVRIQIGGGMVVGRGVMVNGQFIGGGMAAPSGWRDAVPILAGGRVILTPTESDKLHCLDLRSGAVHWRLPRGDALYVAGVVDGRVILVGRHTVDSISLDAGKSTWEKPLALNAASPSGRGILTDGRLFLPVDTAEVIEIELAKGRIAGRSPSRGGAVPGNLLAFRGEVISQGVDSLDVFHQAATLEDRVETAMRVQPPDPWAVLWRGQLDLEGGRIADGMRRIREARAADPGVIPAGVVADALLFAMRSDFQAAVPLWREMVQPPESLPQSNTMLCLAIDGFLRAGELADAWRASRQFLAAAEREPEAAGDAARNLPENVFPGELLEDGADPRLTISESRWFQGRLATLLAKAPEQLRAEIGAFIDGRLAELLAASPAEAGELIRFVESFGVQAMGPDARRRLADAVDRMIADEPRAGQSARGLSVRLQLLRLELSRSDVPPAAANRDGASAGLGGAAESSGSIDLGTELGADLPSDLSSDLNAEWPVGRVAPHRGGRARPEDMARGSRVIPIPMHEGARPAVRGLRVGCDLSTQSLVITDGFGRRLGDPIAIETKRVAGMNVFFQPTAAEATAIGPVVMVGSGGVFVAFDVPPDGGTKPKKLWMVSDATEGPAELAGIGMGFVRQAGGRLRRNANVPLGMRVSEPDELGAAAVAPAMLALANGVAILADRSLQFRDAATGAMLWQRHRLPIAGEVIGDDRFLCVCPRDGKGAVVVSTTDGGIVRTCDLPRHDRRLAVCGRRLVVIEGVASGTAPQAGRPLRVRLELLDPATLERTPLGEYAAEARAALAGNGVVAVVEPNGKLTVLDTRRGAIRFRTRLNDMPAGIEQLQVIPWQDRFLVIVGRPETPEEQKQFEKLGVVAALPQMTPGEESIRLFTGSIWAVAAKTGEMLWPVPATIARHAVHQNQPSELPVLMFSRQIMLPRQGDRFRVSLLCLDKRTGHAVHADDKIMAQPHMFVGCDISGDPATHSITISRIGSESPDVRLDFTGEPMSPRPPFQASTKTPVTGDLFTELQYWLQRALTIPLPF
jgi:outer membrane protein assembly factor BamB